MKATFAGLLLMVPTFAFPIQSEEEVTSLGKAFREFPDEALWLEETFFRHVRLERPSGDPDQDRLLKYRELPPATQGLIRERLEAARRRAHAGWLGIGGAPYDPDEPPGLLLQEVVKDSPAERGGLRPGDRIVKMNGAEVNTGLDLLEILGRLKAGDPVEVVALRVDQRITLKILLARRPPPSGGDPLGTELRKVPFAPPPPLPLKGIAPSPTALRDAASAGARHLLTEQQPDGSWSYRAETQVPAAERSEEYSLRNGSAVVDECTPWLMTSLACMGLRGAKAIEPELSVDAAVAKGLEFVLASREITGGIYRHLVVDFLCTEHARTSDARLRERIRESVAGLTKSLLAARIPKAGWGYGRMCASFITAPVLLSLHRAAAIGVEVQAEALKDAVAALVRTRVRGAAKGERNWYPGEEGREWYIYMVGNQADVSSRLRGGGGRIPMCDLALLRHGARTRADVDRGLAAFLEVRDELDRVLGNRGIPTGPYANASYYYLYDHYYAALAAREAGDETLKKRVCATIQEVLLTIRDKEGAWIDHPAFGRVVGTALALMAMGETA